MPCLEVVDLDAGHAVNIQAADAFNAAVTRFLAGRR
jgi:pimeloyl-ACP methyl ester carboxylesterase